MRPIASGQSQNFLALNEVFGTRAQIRLLRFLATETEGPVAFREAAARTGMTPAGARRSLGRLADAGVVERVETGNTARYVWKREDRLANEILKLFELERGNVSLGLTRDTMGSDSERGNGGDGNGKPNGNCETRVSEKPDGNGSHHGTADFRLPLDPEDPFFHQGLLALLGENLSLIKRARQRVLQKLEHRHPNNGHDDWEWRKILDTYPLPKLLHFLESDSPRALRLRKSSPFAEVLSEEEKAKLKELVVRVH